MNREKVNTKTEKELFDVGCGSTNKVMKDQNGCFIMNENEKRISQKFDNITEFHHGFAVFTVRDKQGIIDRDGNIVIEAKYQNVVFDSNLYRICENGKWGLMNIKMKIICKPRFDFIETFKGRKYARIMIGTKWGAISKSGRMVMAPSFSYLDDVNDEVIVAGYPGMYGAIDIHGNTKVPFKFTRATECKKSMGL